MNGKVLATSLSQRLLADVALRHDLPPASVSMNPLRDAAFLQRLDNGEVAPDVEDYELIADLRQYSKFSYKVRVAPSKLQQDEAINKYRDRNRRCSERNGLLDAARVARQALRHDPSKLPGPCARVAFLAKFLCQRFASAYKGPGLPKHGPGTTFYGYDTKINKYRYLERDVPKAVLRRFASFLRPSPASAEIEGLATDNVCRISFVPKDARGPRLVAPHHASVMWAQQAVLSGIECAVARKELLLRHHVYGIGEVASLTLDDQSVNRSVAMVGSVHPSLYGTFDLKDASDLVQWKLVCFLFGNTPLLLDLRAVRATHVEYPDGTREALWSHAPMGSACCFPVMAIILWSLAVATMWVCDEEVSPDRLECWYRGFHEPDFYLAQKAFVFGDDIIMPPHYRDAFNSVLKLAGLTLNTAKTFTGHGGFRESCGCEAYRGQDITPVLLKVGGISSVSDCVSLITMYNRLSDRYYQLGEGLLQELIQSNRLHRGASWVGFTATSREHSLILVDSVCLALRLNRKLGALVRWNTNIQRYEVLCVRPKVDSEQCDTA